MAARKRSRIPVECRCTRVRHVHGEYTCYASCGCGCEPCTEAAREYRAESRVRLAETGPAFVPVGPVREHVELLRAHGIGTRRLSVVSGVNARLIQAIVTGTRGPRDVEQLTVNRDAAAALLAVRPSAVHVSARRQIDATGTRRRLQALAAIGWSRAELARRAGLTPTSVGRVMRAERCAIGTARKVHALYEQLWDQAPAAATGPDRQARSRALAEAAAHGWAKPMAWDDDTIDDPTASPATSPTGRIPATDRLDELVFLYRAGTPLEEAARRCGYASLDSARGVAARHDHPAARLTDYPHLVRAA